MPEEMVHRAPRTVYPHRVARQDHDVLLGALAGQDVVVVDRDALHHAAHAAHDDDLVRVCVAVGAAGQGQRLRHGEVVACGEQPGVLDVARHREAVAVDLGHRDGDGRILDQRGQTLARVLLQLRGRATRCAHLADERDGDGAVGPDDGVRRQTFVLEHADAHDVCDADDVGLPARIVASRIGVKGAGVRRVRSTCGREHSQRQDQNRKPQERSFHLVVIDT
jgi:hypothetical protein